MSDVTTRQPDNSSNPTVMPAQNQGSSALVEVEQSRAIAEAQASILVARRFPRDVISSIERIKMECTRPALAEKAEYSYAKGGSAIEGPTIRLAEMLARNWGNIESGIRELDRRPSVGKVPGESTVEAFAIDLETNTKQRLTFQVPHWRDTKQGGYPIKDEREVYELIANKGARRRRSCILGLIPGDIVEMALDECEQTLKNANKNVTPEKIKSMVEMFSGKGVTVEQIEKRIQRKIDAIDGPLIISLGKIYNSLSDGMSKPQDWFEPITSPSPQSDQNTEQKSETPQGKDEWEAVVEDELLPGLESLKDEKALDEYVAENQAVITDLSKSKSTKAINRWAQAVTKKRTALKGGKLA